MAPIFADALRALMRTWRSQVHPLNHSINFSVVLGASLGIAFSQGLWQRACAQRIYFPSETSQFSQSPASPTGPRAMRENSTDFLGPGRFAVQSTGQAVSFHQAGSAGVGLSAGVGQTGSGVIPYTGGGGVSGSIIAAPTSGGGGPQSVTLAQQSVMPQGGTPLVPTAPPSVSPSPGTGIPPNWDPFAPPGTTPPPGLFTEPAGPTVFPRIQETWSQARRFLETVSVDTVWMPGDGAKELGLTDVELTATFAVPIGQLDWPLFITPGFAFQFWNGPKQPSAELPPQTYEAFLESAWYPQLSQLVGAELAVRVGVYSDFQQWVEESLRLQGRGLGVISLAPDLKLKLGVWYLDRNRVKILPAGGLVWTPTNDSKLEAVFPNPRLAVRLPGYTAVEWWLYLRGEYGGDAWTVELKAPGYGPHAYEVDYNDFRVGVGLEFTSVRQVTGLIEIGGAFGRELVYVEPISQPALPAFRPNSTIYIRGALAY